MTTTDGAKPADSSAVSGAARLRLTAPQREALAFLRSGPGPATKILVGEPASGKTTLLDRYCAGLGAVELLRARGDGTGLMDSLLRTAGLEPETLSDTVRKDLLVVFLERRHTTGRRVVIAVDDAERLETQDWAMLERLHALQREGRVNLDLVIAGRPKVYEHLRSPLGRWHRVQARFHILRPAGGEPAEHTTTESHLIVTQYGEVIDRPPLKARTLIGRNCHNDICLNHPSISRHHALIAATPDGCYIADLHSKNGLKVNGKRVSSAALRHDDIVIVGPYRLKLVLENAGRRGDSDSPPAALADTATLRVKALRRRLEASLLGGIEKSAS